MTGNAPLVNVLREALARDAVARGELARGEANRRVKAAIQNVHRFLEDCALDAARVPPERLIVFDEAQRAWDEAKARRGTQNRPGRLTMSEPAHTLQIMGRHGGFAVVVAIFLVVIGWLVANLLRVRREREAIEGEEYRMFDFLHGLGEKMLAAGSARAMHRGH